MEKARLVVGLGNPGREYVRTRHNAGFMVLDQLAKRWRADWVAEKKFHCRLARVEREQAVVFLCQPQTFMNASGETTGLLANFYRLPSRQVLVVVDDADLPFGTIRLRPSGSSGGHHGLESIEAHLGTRDYPRQRIGIGRTDAGLREITGHVLSDFSRTESGLLEKVLQRAGDQIECWLARGVQPAMNLYNGVITSPERQ
jgi:PTH1 family peptidyl-tRNA hydrolase